MQRLILLLFLCASTVQAGAEEAVDVDATGYIAFGHLDSDNNGYVSRVEARSIAGVEQAFDRTDSNGDSLLDRQEYSQLRPEQQSKHRPAD